MGDWVTERLEGKICAVPRGSEFWLREGHWRMLYAFLEAKGGWALCAFLAGKGKYWGLKVRSAQFKADWEAQLHNFCGQGRLLDYGIEQKNNPGWKRLRTAQFQVARSHQWGMRLRSVYLSQGPVKLSFLVGKVLRKWLSVGKEMDSCWI